MCNTTGSMCSLKCKIIDLNSPRRFPERTCASAIFASRVVKRPDSARDERKTARHGKLRQRKGEALKKNQHICFYCFININDGYTQLIA